MQHITAAKFSSGATRVKKVLYLYKTFVLVRQLVLRNPLEKLAAKRYMQSRVTRRGQVTIDKILTSMLKRTIKYGLLTTAVCVLTFLYLVYFGENRISLMLNQGVNVPHDLHDVSIESRRGLFAVLFNTDAHTIATCKTSKKSLMEWLKTSKFEVIHLPKDTSSNKMFYTSYDSLPPEIIQNKIDYTIQLQRTSSDMRHLSVEPIDSDNVYLTYEMDWN